jgi:hypothetical protein
MLHDILVGSSVGLGAKRIDRGTFASIELTVLQAGFIRRFGHFSAEGVQLSDQMTFAGTTDGGIAGHVADGVQIYSKADRVKAHPGAGQRRFNARVARSDYGDIALSGLKIHKGNPQLSRIDSLRVSA